VDRINPPTFRTLFNIKYQLHCLTTTYIAFHGYITYHCYCVEITVHQRHPTVAQYSFNCHTRMVWLPRLRNLTLDSPRLAGKFFLIHLKNLNLHHVRIVEGMGLKNYGIEIISNGTISLLNFI
jgi:hypothetical protein